MKTVKTTIGYVKNIPAAAGNFAVLFISLSYFESVAHSIIGTDMASSSLWIFLFLPSISCILSAFTGVSDTEKRNRMGMFLVVALLSFFYIAESVYFLTFGSLISVSMVGMGGAALADFGWSIADIVKDSIWKLALFLIPVLLMVIYWVRADLPAKKIKLKWRFLLLLLSILLWTLTVMLLPISGREDYTAYGAYHSRFVDTDTASSKIGILTNVVIETKSLLFGYENRESIEKEGNSELDEPEEKTEDTSANVLDKIDFDALRKLAEDETAENTLSYMASVEPTYKNEYTGMFEGYNLIYICAESFDTLALDPDVTPTLYRLATEGIVLENYYNSFKNTTTNGEFALLTGIWPDVSRSASNGTAVGSMAQSAYLYMPTALGNMMNTALKTQSLGYHNYKGDYYRRNMSLPNFGFSCKFMDDGMTFTSQWPASDLEMMEQSVDDYIYSDEPFSVYYMTFSGHGQYSDVNPIYEKNIETVKQLIEDDSTVNSVTGYLACNYELDKAMEYLLDRLEEAGKLENTLIVMAGDHYPYYIDDEDRNEAVGHEVDSTFEMYESTCIMWAGSLEEPVTVDVPCCNVDVLPTVLNLMGADYDSRLYAGTDIFSSGPHRAILYNKSFVTDKVMYDNTTGEAVWLLDTSLYDDDLLDDYLASNIKAVKNRYQMSINICDTDLYDFIFENSGLK